MKHRKSLLVSIWIVAVGIVLWIIGSVIRDTWAWAMNTNKNYMYYLGVGVMWTGVIALVFAVFGVITTVVMEYMDRGPKTASPAPV